MIVCLPIPIFEITIQYIQNLHYACCILQGVPACELAGPIFRSLRLTSTAMPTVESLETLQVTSISIIRSINVSMERVWSFYPVNCNFRELADGIIVIITVYLPSCFGQETAKGLSVFESSYHLPTCLPRTDQWSSG